MQATRLMTLLSKAKIENTNTYRQGHLRSVIHFQFKDHNCWARFTEYGEADFKIEPIDDPSRAEFDHFTASYLKYSEAKKFLNI